MPTSKDILRKSKAAFDKHSVSARALKDSIDTSVKDAAEFAKARQVLRNSLTALKHTEGVTHDRLKSLNSELSKLQKNAPVMQAPADKKVYDQLVASYQSNVREGMKLAKELSDTLKKVEKVAKG